MNCLDVPVAADEFLSEEIEEFWMGWECPLKSEVIRSSNDPFSEVMVPESVDSDTGEKVACSILRVGNPIGETASAIAGAGPVSGWLFFPMISGFTVSHEDLKVVWISNSLFLFRVAAAKKVCLWIKVGKTSAVCMVLGWTESFTGDLDFCL